jgi:hypothetical protein
MPKKICFSCKKENHPRCKICTCGQKFVFKPKKNEKYKSINWKDLVKGDIILVKGGPIWINSSGVKLSMGYKGKYKVLYLDDDGIVSYGCGNGNMGFCHIWMKNKQKKENGIIKIPHKIKKIK